MIEITRLNGHPMILNAEQIKTVERTPDTMITLLNGEQLMVKEELQEVVERAVHYLRRLRIFKYG